MKMALKSDPSKCIGCMLCTLACSAKHLKTFNPEFSRTGVVDRYPEPGDYYIHHCIQCEEHPCVESCPVDAFYEDEKLGIWKIDGEICTGCGACVEACPYDGCWLSPDDKALKCDLCGGNPECVQVCPRGVYEIVKED